MNVWKGSSVSGVLRLLGRYLAIGFGLAMLSVALRFLVGVIL